MFQRFKNVFQYEKIKKIKTQCFIIRSNLQIMKFSIFVYSVVIILFATIQVTIIHLKKKSKPKSINSLIYNS